MACGVDSSNAASSRSPLRACSALAVGPAGCAKDLIHGGGLIFSEPKALKVQAGGRSRRELIGPRPCAARTRGGARARRPL